MLLAARLTDMRGLLPVLLLALLAGCSANWKAPLETRGDSARHQHHSDTKKSPAIRAQSYRVQRGDTLYSIAWRSGNDFRRLARLNRIGPPYTIYPGQLLRLNAEASSHRSAPKSSVHPPRTAVAEPKLVPRPAKRASAVTSTEVQRSDNALHWLWPAEGSVLAKYAAQDSTRQGVKIGGKAGQSVIAAEAGRVVYSGSGLIGYGQLIIIKHNDNYLSAYGHNAKLLVKEGDQVARGKHIADMGRSNDGQAMLHFEIRREGRPVDPLALLPRR